MGLGMGAGSDSESCLMRQLSRGGTLWVTLFISTALKARVVFPASRVFSDKRRFIIHATGSHLACHALCWTQIPFFGICVCHNMQKGEAAVLRVAILKLGGSSKSSRGLVTVEPDTSPPNLILF